MKKFSIYHFLVVILLFSLMMPAGVANAGKGHGHEATGSLTIYKFQQDVGDEQGQNPDGSKLDKNPDGRALPMVKFEFTKTHSYDATNDEWKEIDNPTSFTKTTGNDGKIVMDNMELGRYKVQEIDGPPHVTLNDEAYFVDIPMTNKAGTSANYDVHIYPKNEAVRGAVELIKLDGETKEPLSGVTFDLYDSSDRKINDTALVTDENGKIQVDGLPYNTGGFYFKEVKTIDGYLKGAPTHFMVEASGHFAEDGSHVGAVVEVQADNYQKPEIAKAVDKAAVNRGESVTYTLTVDLPGDINEYDSFTIIDELHADLEYVNGSELSPSGFTFNQNGQTLTWEKTGGLTPGEVEVTFEAKISEDAEANKKINNEASIVYYNGYEAGGDKTPKVPVLPTAGTLKVLKQDGDTENRLGGATFELRDMDGNKISSGTTGKNGLLDFGELDYGEYQLVETKAPDGYNKLRNPIDVTIDAEDSNQSLTVNNYKSGWELPKTGGIGTLSFTIVGLLLMGSALVLYIRRRRNETA